MEDVMDDRTFLSSLPFILYDVFRKRGSTSMDDDHYPSLESIAIQVWKDRLNHLVSLPFHTFFDRIDLVRRYYNEASSFIAYYVTKGTVYDLTSDRE